MGTQTMGSNGETRKSMLDGLARQGSLYNLTLDEVQQQLGDLGKPFSSMNLDELLKNVYGAQGNQGMSGGDGTDYNERGSMELRKKTVDEVWQDIQLGQKKKKKKKKKKDGSDTNSTSFKDGDRKPTLGEMTLEDFLVKAGVVAECSSDKNEEQNLDLQVPPWMNYQISSVQQQQQQQLMVPGSYQVPQNLSVIGNPMMDMMGTLSDAHLSGRKRYASGAAVERTVERRQKRMIKNRESAARSRARKQAYTNELENKVSRLEEENERLRRQKEAEEVLPCVPPPEPKYQLRRTTSAPF